jgi:hypothetical protein
MEEVGQKKQILYEIKKTTIMITSTLSREQISQKPQTVLSRQEINKKGLQKQFYFKSVAPSFGEIISRYIFEWIFQNPFPSQYPFFLGGQELDGFNAELMIAFEHQGPYHDPYHKLGAWDGHFKDKFKQEICNENGVILIQVPCINTNKEDISIGLDNIIKQLNDYKISTRLNDMEINEYQKEQQILLEELYNLRKKLMNHKFKSISDYQLFEDSFFMKVQQSTFYFSSVGKNRDDVSYYGRWKESQKYWEDRILQANDGWIKKIYYNLSQMAIVYYDQKCQQSHIIEVYRMNSKSAYNIWLERYLEEYSYINDLTWKQKVQRRFLLAQ